MIGRTSRIVVWPRGRCPPPGWAVPVTRETSQRRPGRCDKCPRRLALSSRATDRSILEGVGKHGDDEEVSTCHASER